MVEVEMCWPLRLFLLHRRGHPAEGLLYHNVRLGGHHGYLAFLCIPLACVAELLLRRVLLVLLILMNQYLLSPIIVRDMRVAGLRVEVVGVDLHLPLLLLLALRAAYFIHILLDGVVVRCLCERHVRLALIHLPHRLL